MIKISNVLTKFNWIKESIQNTGLNQINLSKIKVMVNKLKTQMSH